MLKLPNNILKNMNTEDVHIYIDDPTGEQTSIYKKSMSSNTKGSASRVKRIEAILDYLKSEGMVYEFDKNRIL